MTSVVAMESQPELVLENVRKSYATRAGRRMVLDGASMRVRSGEKIGVLGRNGAGKSTLIRLISGAERPDTGRVIRGMTVSWPLAFGGAFQGALTGLDNLRFICRVYGTSVDDKIEFVERFTELGRYLREPVRTYSAGMRARLAFAISMVVEFDCFLIDEIVSVGDARFHEKCNTELFVRRADRAMIIVSHDPGYIRTHCERALVLSDGKLRDFSDIDSALDFYLREQLNTAGSASLGAEAPAARAIDLSQPAEPEELRFSLLEGFVFGEGWGAVEVANGLQYRWTTSPQAIIRLPVSRGYDYELRLRLGTHAGCTGQKALLMCGALEGQEVGIEPGGGAEVWLRVPSQHIVNDELEIVVAAVIAAPPVVNSRPLALICTRMSVTRTVAREDAATEPLA